MRKALIVGIDHYDQLPSMSSCVDDARAVRGVLERHADGTETENFIDPTVLTTSPTNMVKKSQLRDALYELFSDNVEVSLFYFAGHGHVEDTGGFLCASDSDRGDDGIALSEVMTLATKSPALNKIIVLDSCYGGAAGSRPTEGRVSEITEGMTILTASTAEQAAKAIRGRGGLFTSLLVDALGGAAANLLGEITPGSVYAHID
jgi:uncharacterized caspase-like protein